jgi:hypothetical protein
LSDSREGSPGPGITSGHGRAANSSGVGKAKAALKEVTEKRRAERKPAECIVLALLGRCEFCAEEEVSMLVLNLRFRDTRVGFYIFLGHTALNCGACSEVSDLESS